MKERPILFTPENVLKVMRGKKWQTRRVIDPQPEERADGWHVETRPRSGYSSESTMRSLLPVYCPFGKEGDRLWIRESLYGDGSQWLYRADNTPVLVDPTRQAESVTWAHHKTTSYASAIHMPRFACRLFLDITSVRVERLQDISHDDMRAEGVRPEHEGSLLWRESLAERFRQLWDSINGDRGQGWEVNPWVWAITFERVAT